jgi:hypothetical protein
MIRRRVVPQLTCVALAALTMTFAAAAATRNAPLLAELPPAVASGQAAALKPLPGEQRMKLAINLTLRNPNPLPQAGEGTSGVR